MGRWIVGSVGQWSMLLIRDMYLREFAIDSLESSFTFDNMTWSEMETPFYKTVKFPSQIN